LLLPLTVMSLSLLWILLVSLLARTLFPNRFSNFPRLGLTIWFGALLSSILAATTAVLSLVYAYFYSLSKVSAAKFGEQDWIANFLLSFVPWAALAIFGVILTLINLRIEEPVVQGRDLQKSFDLAKKFLKDFEGVKVFVIALPFNYALASHKDIIVSEKLLDSLTVEELDAVLWHELGHIKGKHRALKSIANFVSLLSKPMNISRVFQQSVYELCEIAADRFASQRVHPELVQSVRSYFVTESSSR
jgi:Zn-dependent protease with chaperone function